MPNIEADDYKGVSSFKPVDKEPKTLTIDLPISAQGLELRLHTFCDHHGWDYDVVGTSSYENGGECGSGENGKSVIRLHLEPNTTDDEFWN